MYNLEEVHLNRFFFFQNFFIKVWLTYREISL